VRRREFIGLLSSAALTPLAVRAEQNATGTRTPKIGILWGVGIDPELLGRLVGTSEVSAKNVLIEALANLGYVDGKSAQLVQRFPEAAADVSRFAQELIDNEVNVVIAVSAVGAIAAKPLTSSIPIVVVYTADPVGSGLVESLAHPGGNVTGLSLMGGDLIAKRLALLKEAFPAMSRVALLFDPTANYALELKAQRDAAGILGLQFRALSAPTTDAIDRAFAEVETQGEEGVAIATQPMMTRESARIAAAALARKIPTVGYHPGMTRDGLLMSYGQDFAEYLRKAAALADKILKGAKPAELPVEQPTVLKLTVNLKTAKAIGLTIPTPLLIAADEVIE
jgi:putative tryptophan/tyrosine transport system substrate-binding protein